MPEPSAAAVCLCIAFASPLFANAEVNCSNPRTGREQVVCSAQDLRALDTRLDAALAGAQKQLSVSAAADVNSDQLAWLSWVEKVCTSALSQDAQTTQECFGAQYKQRLGQFSDGLVRAGGMQFYPRARFIFKLAGKQVVTADPVAREHPYGYGDYAWPQIDQPSAVQALWNESVRQAAVRIEGHRDGNSAPDLDLSVQGDRTRDGSFTITAANDRLISIAFSCYTYEWGAAHGGTEQISFSWWLDRKRALSLADVFRANSDWKQRMQPLVMAQLQNRPGKEALWSDPKELTKGLSTGLERVDAFSISRQGVTVTFGQYVVGPYASGMPAATVSWQALGPLVVPDLHPETLPERRKTATN